MKQSAAVVALFLGTASAIRHAPKNINLFATGSSGDEDLGQNIIMKGDKFHYNQFGQVEIEESAQGAPASKGVRFIQGDEKKDAKPEAKEDKKDAKDDEKKDAKDDKKEDKKDDKKEDKKDDKKEDDDEKKDGDEKKEDGEEKKEEKKD